MVPETAVEFAAGGLLSDAEGGVQVRAVVPCAQRFAVAGPVGVGQIPGGVEGAVVGDRVGVAVVGSAGGVEGRYG